MTFAHDIIISEMSTSMTPSEKIQLLSKHSGDTQLETPSSKRQGKSHPFRFDNLAETYIYQRGYLRRVAKTSEVVSRVRRVAKDSCFRPSSILG